MLICIHKPTNRIIEMQSNATQGTLYENGVRLGYNVTDLLEVEVDMARYLSYLENDPVYIATQAELARQAEEAAQKETDVATNLPSWTSVSTAIGNIANLTDAKAILLKLARVVYWLAKDSAT